MEDPEDIETQLESFPLGFNNLDSVEIPTEQQSFLDSTIEVSSDDDESFSSTNASSDISTDTSNDTSTANTTKANKKREELDDLCRAVKACYSEKVHSKFSTKQWYVKNKHNFHCPYQITKSLSYIYIYLTTIRWKKKTCVENRRVSNL